MLVVLVVVKPAAAIIGMIAIEQHLSTCSRHCQLAVLLLLPFPDRQAACIAQGMACVPCRNSTLSHLQSP